MKSRNPLLGNKGDEFHRHATRFSASLERTPQTAPFYDRMIASFLQRQTLEHTGELVEIDKIMEVLREQGPKMMRALAKEAAAAEQKKFRVVEGGKRSNPDTPWAGPDKTIRNQLHKNNDSYLVVDKHGLGSTWMQGGCWVAAEAIKRRFGGELLGIWDSRAGLCHVAVEKRGAVIDAEGKPLAKAAFIKRYAREEFLAPPVWAEPFKDHQGERAGIIYDEEAVVETLALLK